MREVEVRRCEARDCLAIAALGRKTWGDWANGAPLPRQLIELHHPVYVAEDVECGLVGYCIGVGEAFGRGGWILTITLAPQFQRCGIGTRLLRSVVDEFRMHDTLWIGTTIQGGNVASMKLFEKFGFVKEREIKDYYDNDETILRYTLKF